MKFKTLYAKSSSGKIKTWQIEADGNIMRMSSGYEDGKISTTERIVHGLNIGKANETTDNEQCIKECESKYKKKLDEQYVEDKNKIIEYSEQEVLLPMLALRFQDRKHDIKFPCYVQPKLNGVRCIYQNEKFMSRQAKEYTTLSHLVPELKNLGIKIPDGEIYVHGMNFQEIIRLVKKDRGADNSKLEYWIYDEVNDETFQDRTTEIERAFSKSRYFQLIKVPTYIVRNEKEIKEYHDKFVQDGFEGAIIRNVDGKYKVKHRSPDLQKYKEFIDDEFIIVGGHEGSGGDIGTIIFEVKNKDGNIFSVRPKGTREQRIKWMKDIETLKGKELTVRYQNLSELGIPIFPVGICIRDYE